MCMHMYNVHVGEDQDNRRVENEAQYVLHTPTCIHSSGMVQLNDESSGGPLVVVVRPSPPGIGKWSYPRPWIVLTPFTCTEQDGLTSLVQSP